MTRSPIRAPGPGRASRRSGPLVAAALAVLSWGAVEGEAQTRTFDLLIRGGSVVDGTGNPPVRADVGVDGDEIVAVGDLSDADGRRVLDATGLHVAPGFIDLHPHTQPALLSDDVRGRQAYSLHHQGLTTVAGGADGRTPGIDLQEQVDEYERLGTTMNVALLVGHNTIRAEVMGDDYERPATGAEVARMQALVREGMEFGAFGLTAGLEYVPGRYSTTEEVVELARVLADYDGFYIAHQRAEGLLPMGDQPSDLDMWPVHGMQALEETVRIARETGIRVVASHQKARGRGSWGRSAFDTVIVNRAREEEGLQVYLDVYPYETFGGSASAMLPGWAVAEEEDGDEGYSESLRRRWEDEDIRPRIIRDIEWEVDHNGGPDRVYVLDHPDERIVGRTLAEISEMWGLPYQNVVVELQHTGYPDRVGGAALRGFGMHPVDIETYYRMDYTAFGSDARVTFLEGEGPEALETQVGHHPRHWGAFARYLAHYVRDRQVVPLSQGVRALTGLPAQIIGLEDRGYLLRGYKADLVLFDYARLEDRSTIFEPALPAEGIEYVIVNGEITVERGEHTGALPGVVIRKGR